MGENNVPISGDLIQEKALKFAAEKGIKDFFASDGCLVSKPNLTLVKKSFLERKAKKRHFHLS